MGPDNKAELEDDVEGRGPDDAEDDGADSVEEGDEETGEQNEAPEGDEGGDEEEEEIAAEPRRSARDIRDSADRLAQIEQRERELAARDAAEQQRRQREEEEKERNLLAQMNEGEQAQYLLAKKITGIERTLHQTNADTIDRADKIESDKYLTQPRYKKYAADVERAYHELRRQGTQVSRVAVLDYIVGKELRLRGEAEGDRQRQEGQKRIARARGKPGRAQSDVGGGRRQTSVVSRAETEDWVI